MVESGATANSASSIRLIIQRFTIISRASSLKCRLQLYRCFSGNYLDFLSLTGFSPTGIVRYGVFSGCGNRRGADSKVRSSTTARVFEILEYLKPPVREL